MELSHVEISNLKIQDNSYDLFYMNDGVKLEIMATSKVRLNVNVAAPVAGTLDRLAKDKGYSRSDIMQQALLLLDAVASAKKKGGRLVILNEEGGVVSKTDIVGLIE